MKEFEGNVWPYLLTASLRITINPTLALHCHSKQRLWERWYDQMTPTKSHTNAECDIKDMGRGQIAPAAM